MFSGIQNYYELLVFERIQAVVENADEDFLEDVACVVLNSLPPRYIRHQIDLTARLSIEERAGLDREVEKAVGDAVKLIEGRRSNRLEE